MTKGDWVKLPDCIKTTKSRKEAFGIAQADISKDEFIISVNLLTGEITGNKIRFLPWGKKKIRKLFINSL